jgi:hypothetical protein
MSKRLLAIDRLTTRHPIQNPNASDRHWAERGVYGLSWPLPVTKSTPLLAQAAAPAFFGEAGPVKMV